MERLEDDQHSLATHSDSISLTDRDSQLSPDLTKSTVDLATPVTVLADTKDNVKLEDSKSRAHTTGDGSTSNLQSSSVLSQSLSSVYMMAKMSARSKHVIRDARDSGRITLVQVWLIDRHTFEY